MSQQTNRNSVCIHPRSSAANNPFRMWGGVGLLCALLAALSFTIRAGLSPVVLLVLALLNLGTAFVLAMTIKVVTGKERHTHYHYEIAVLIVTTFTLLLLGQPVLRYLDVIVVGKGILLAIGRVGCFKVGCCHGRPSRLGLRYAEFKDGFARHYAGVRLFPVQLLEASIVLFLTAGCGYLLLSDAQPGTSLSVYVAGYAAARFFIEFLRGDPQRPYLLGYSEAQWTAVLLLSLIVGLEYSSVLPFYVAHVIVAGSVLLAMPALSQTQRKMLAPRHLAELAEAFEFVSHTDAEKIQTVRTSQGVQISSSHLQTATAHVEHYSLSQPNGEMSEKTARILLRLVPQLSQAIPASRLIAGHRGVFHLLVYNRLHQEAFSAAKSESLRPYTNK